MNQEVLISVIFTTHTGEWMTPFQIKSICEAVTGNEILLTSVRRAITNLTRKGTLMKSSSANMMGLYGAANYTWTKVVNTIKLAT